MDYVKEWVKEISFPIAVASWLPRSYFSKRHIGWWVVRHHWWRSCLKLNLTDKGHYNSRRKTGAASGRTKTEEEEEARRIRGGSRKNKRMKGGRIKLWNWKTNRISCSRINEDECGDIRKECRKLISDWRQSNTEKVACFPDAGTSGLKWLFRPTRTGFRRGEAGLLVRLRGFRLGKIQFLI